MDSGMLKCFETLELISRVSGRNQKLELLRTLQSNDFAKFYFKALFDNNITFGISTCSALGNSFSILDVNHLKALVNTLSLRELTGSAARQTICETISTDNALVNKWLKAMWEKTLRIGISSSSIDKVFPGLVPRFGVQLAESLGNEDLRDGWIVQPKYDGLRCVLIFRNHKCLGALSRNGKSLFNIDCIVRELEKHIENGVLDGEICGKTWNETASVVKASKSNRALRSVRFNAFDWLTLEEWDQKQGIVMQEERLVKISLLPNNLVYSIKTPYYNVGSVEDAWNFAKKFLDLGYEGAVAKRLRGVYQFDRSRDWLKMKFEETYDAKIVAYKEGTGRHKNKLGAFICKLGEKDVNIGGGYSDEEREEFWKIKDKMIGRVIEVKGQEKTSDGSLRFPVFIRLRMDK